MHILIIGGTAFMGPHVVHGLHEMGHQVTLFHRGNTQTALPAGVNEIFGDRTQLRQHAETLRQVAPDVVLDMILVTAEEAQVVMEIFKGVAKRVVAASSADAYRAYNRLRGVEPGPPDPVPLTEDSPLRETYYPYRGQTLRDADDPMARMDYYDKVLLERVILGELALPGTIVRLPAVFGPGDRQHRLFAYLKRMDDKRPTIILQADWADWCFGYGYVEDMAHALVLAVTDERAAGRVYNAANQANWTQADLIRLLREVTGWDGEVVTVPKDRLPESMQVEMNLAQHMFMDSSRIRSELGFVEKVETAVAFRRTIEWERANPPDPIDPQQFDYQAEDAILAALS